MKKKKREKWVKWRHRVVRNLLFLPLGTYIRLKYRVKIKPFREKKKRQYLILTNHQTPFDQFFIGMSFRGAIYYMASEDIFSMGWISRLIRFLIAPIPIKKQTTDVKAVLNCMRVAKEGGTICIAPEGNRTYSGKPCHINPAIVPLARKLGLPIALYRIEGGYGTHPRWSDKVRRGKMYASVARLVDPEEYASLSDEELYAIIRQTLTVDEASVDILYHSRHRAEYLERVLYVCPDCGLARFESHGDTVRCLGCGMSVRYLESKELEGVEKKLPFRYLADWYAYQEDFVRALDLAPYEEKPLFTDEGVALSRVIPYEKKVSLIKRATASLYASRIVVSDGEKKIVFSFDEVSAVTVLGRNKANIYIGKDIYQLKGDKRFNALKYMHIYRCYTGSKEGKNEGLFLGI